MNNQDKLASFNFMRQQTHKDKRSSQQQSKRQSFPPVATSIFKEANRTFDINNSGGFRNITVDPISAVFPMPSTAQTSTRDKERIFQPTHIDLEQVSNQQAYYK